MSGLPDGLKAYLRVPFVMIVWVMETYASNREKLRAFMARPRTARTFKAVIAATVVVWIVVALIANEQQGQRLTDAVQGLWSETKSLNEQRQSLQQDQEPGS